MERLTWEMGIDGFTDIGLRNGVTKGDAICRLAAYEDTGLEPEEVKKLAEAEKDGRLVVLQNGMTVRRLQNECRIAKRMANVQFPSSDYTTGSISGFDAGKVCALEKILTNEEAEAAMEARRREADNT